MAHFVLTEKARKKPLDERGCNNNRDYITLTNTK